MCTVTMTLPDEVLLALKVSPETLAEELRLAAAVKLFELRRLSSGAATRRSTKSGTGFEDVAK